MISLPAALAMTVVVVAGVRVWKAVVDQVEVREAVTGGARGGRSAAAIVVLAAGQSGKASGVARC